MKRILLSLTMSALLTGLSWAQSTAGAPANTADRIAPGSLIPAELTKTVDAKKAKAGDLVQAKTSQELIGQDGSVVVPAGARIVGHVTEATAREKGETASTLGIVFDKIIFKDGREVPMGATIQALAPPVFNASNMANDPMSEAGGAHGTSSQPSGGMYGGMTRPAGSSPSENPGAGSMGTGGAGNSRNTASSAGGGRLSTNAQGVVGIQGLSLQGDVLTSQKKNVKLDSGTQLMLRAGGQH